MIVYLLLAVIGAGLVVAGVWAWSPPAGLVTAGVELLGAAYVGAYMTVRRDELR